MKNVYMLGFDNTGKLFVMNSDKKIEPVLCPMGRGICDSHCIHCGSIHGKFEDGKIHAIKNLDDAKKISHESGFVSCYEYWIDISCGNNTKIVSEYIFEQGKSGFFFVLEPSNMLKWSYDEFFGNKNPAYEALEKIADMQPDDEQEKSIVYIRSLCREMIEIARAAIQKSVHIPYKAEEKAKGEPEA